MSRFKTYPYLVWFSTLLLGPVAYMLMTSSIGMSAPIAIPETTVFFFLFGIMFSAPAFFIYLLIFQYLLRDNLPPMPIKFFACLTAIIGLIVTLYFVGLRDFGEKNFRRFIIAYSIVIAFASFVFKIKNTRKS